MFAELFLSFLQVNEHIAKLREKFGKFKYAPHRIQFNPSDPDQIKIMLPNYKGPVPQRVRPQSRALSRLSAHSGTVPAGVPLPLGGVCCEALGCWCQFENLDYLKSFV